tara:strand:+ start:2686 stop:2964 length:279 start_codon:yes stop_codon:yes gene_type:complete
VKYLRVKTDVHNDSCQEERELVFKNKETLTATVRFNDEKPGYVWAARFNDRTWHLSIGGLSLENVCQETMLKLLKAINDESEKHNVTSDVSA